MLTVFAMTSHPSLLLLLSGNRHCTMKIHNKIFTILISVTTILSACGAEKTIGRKENKDFSIISVMSFNVRVDMPSDTPNTWTNRKLWVEDIMSKEDVIGVQELTPTQYEDLRKAFPESMLTYSTGKDPANGNGTSCFNAIFYNAGRVKVTDHGTFWLSDTPDRPSKGWDGAYVRSCNWAKFEDMKGKQFYLFNTHLDNAGTAARTKGAKLIIKKIKEITGKEGGGSKTQSISTPVLITGDFNTTIDGDAVRIICKHPSSKTIKPGRFSNAATICEEPAKGPLYTYHGWMKISEYQRETIDFIFAKNIKKVCSFRVDNDSISPNIPATQAQFPSDHFPITAMVVF